MSDRCQSTHHFLGSADVFLCFLPPPLHVLSLTETRLLEQVLEEALGSLSGCQLRGQARDLLLQLLNLLLGSGQRGVSGAGPGEEGGRGRRRREASAKEK